MSMNRGHLHSIILLTALAIPCRLLAGPEDSVLCHKPLEPLKIVFVSGYGASTRIDDARYKENRQKNFAGQNVVFKDNSAYLNQEELPAAAKGVDVFFYSGHSGQPSEQPGTHVLVAQAGSETKPALVTSVDVKKGLKGGSSPRLVIINGCKTTDTEDGVPIAMRMSTAFGIQDGMKGKAYLGWPKLVPGFLADDQIGKLLSVWTVADDNGQYPTIDEARRKVGIENLRIIGDKHLRYRTVYLLKSSDAKQQFDRPIKTYWDATGDKSATVTIDFGPGADQELRQIGLKRKIEFKATRSGNNFVIRDPEFDRMIISIGKAFNTTIKVHEAKITIAADGTQMKISIFTNLTSTFNAPNSSPSTSSSTLEWRAIPMDPSKPPA